MYERDCAVASIDINMCAVKPIREINLVEREKNVIQKLLSDRILYIFSKVVAHCSMRILYKLY